MARKPIQVVHDSWDTYVARAEEGPVFISFDVEAAQQDLTDTLTNCARVIIPIQRPNDNGGPVPPESDYLYAIEDELCKGLVQHRVLCRLVGRITASGVRELVFQLDDWETFRPPVGAWMANHEEYEIDVSEHEGWTFFDDCIRPNADIWLMLADRSVVHSLLESGSNPEKKHALEFVFNGPERGLRALARKLEAEGYVPELPLDYASGQIVMVKRMKLDEEAIFDESLANRDLAQKHGVEYDGWGAMVVK